MHAANDRRSGTVSGPNAARGPASAAPSRSSSHPSSSAGAAATDLPRGPRTLDALAALGTEALRALYLAGTTPAIGDVRGDLRGRMLAVRGVGRFVGALLRAFARWRFFPWRGKSFTPLAVGRGEGINRVFGDSRPRRWFRFETFVAASRAGGGDAFQLDYDNPGNPFFIRAIKDEIRCVAPGLYLGQAYAVLFGKPRLVLYFGLMAD